MKFTNEQMKKARMAKSVEELMTVAKENGINLSTDEAKKYFESFQNESISDDELANVSGGCGKPEARFREGQRVKTDIGRFEENGRLKFYYCGVVESYKWQECYQTYLYSIRLDVGGTVFLYEAHLTYP